MRVRKPIWTEGLFITQHHLQQLDRYHEALLAARIETLAPHEWGLTELEIDERALAAGQIRVVRMRGVLPEGTPVSAGDHLDDVVPPRPLGTLMPASMATLDVYVGIADESETVGNVELESKSGLSRFVREQTNVSDFNTGGAEHPYQWARRNLRVVLGSEARDRFVGIRVAQLTRSAAGEVVLRGDYVPPVTRVGTSSFLTHGFRRLLEMMISKQRSLAERRRARTEAAVEFQAADAAKFWLLHTLNTHAPVFAHIARGATHPEAAYLELATFIGQLSTFAVEGDPTDVPAFDYLELGATFAPMFQRAQRLLDVVVAENFVEIPLSKRDDGMYLAQLEDRTILQYEFFLMATARDVPEATLRDRLPRLSKVASWKDISAILKSAVNGAKLELEYRPPGALPIRQGAVTFRLKKTPEFWNDIAGTGTIAIYQPLDPNAIEVALFAVDPKNLK
jgi:type VI secretion system protein ImpJ